MSSILKITPIGNLGNQMLQLMLARSMAEQVPGLIVVGYDMPEWGLHAPIPSYLPPIKLILKGQHVEFEMIKSLLKSNRISGLDLSALGFELSHYLPRAIYQNLFPLTSTSIPIFQDDVLLINVRGAEILGNVHEDYGPIPLAFYRQLINKSRLRPVFMGQIGSDWYSQAIKDWFPEAELIPTKGAMSDFATIRCAKNIVISVSTFSWLAAWLSDANTIHLPVFGIFNPAQRPDIQLLPTKDSRYHFYNFPLREWDGNAQQASDLLNEDMQFIELTSSDIESIQVAVRTTIRYRWARLRYRVSFYWRVRLLQQFGIAGGVILKL
jgi:hypothetical protein